MRETRGVERKKEEDGAGKEVNKKRGGEQI